MKKFLIFVFICGLLVACNNTPQEQIESNNTQEEEIMKSEEIYVDVVPASLFEAIYNGNVKGVRKLIANGTDVNIETKCDTDVCVSASYKTPLLSAVGHEETEIVKLLLEAGANPNVKNYGEYTALDLALDKGNKEIIKLLSEAGAKDTPLAAIIRGDIKAVETFLDNGFDVNTKYYKEVEKNNVISHEMDTLLSFAVKNKQMEIIKLLFNRGAKISLFYSKWDDDNELFDKVIETKNTEIIQYFINKDQNILRYICKAVKTNDMDIVKLFLKATKNDSLKYNMSTGGISCAAKEGNLDMLKFLVSQTSNIQNIYIPLEESVESGNIELVKYLFEQKGNINAYSLSQAFDYAQDKDMISLLIKNGANVKDESILYHAIERGNVEKVKLLLEAGANPNVKITYRSIDDTTPLHLAAKNKQNEIAKLLVNARADVNAVDEYGQTPLHYTAENRDAKTAQILIAKGANVNAKDKYDITPLEKALNEIASYTFYNEDIEIEKILINNGADVNARSINYYDNTKGPSPLEKVSRIANKELIKLLCDKGAKVENLYTAAAVGDLKLVKQFLLKESQENKQYALYVAVKNGNREIAEYLIKQGSNIDDGLFFDTIFSNNTDMAKFLIQNGGNVNAKPYANDPVLETSIANKNLEIVKLLLKKGAKITDKTFEVTAAKGNAEIMKELFAKNNKVNLENLLSVAAENGNKSVIDFLIKKGAKTNTLRMAIALGDKQKVQKYLKKGNFFVLTRRGRKPSFFEYKQDCSDIKPGTGQTYIRRISLLYLAVINNQLEIAKLLVQNGESIYDGVEHISCVVDYVVSGHNTYSSTLRLAVERNYLEIVKFLLDNGIYVNDENAFGTTALEYAKTDEMKQLLLKYGAKKGSGKVLTVD